MDSTTPHHPAAPPELVEPAADECVLCYAHRMLERFGCDCTLRWVRRWRQLRLPGATGLESRMQARGGFCDCEIFSNGWELHEDLQVWEEDGEPVPPSVRPACAGVGPRSSQPCANWVPWRRRW